MRTYIGTLAAAAFGALLLAVGGWYAAYSERIVPNVAIGTIDVGSMTTGRAAEVVDERGDQLQRQGIPFHIDGTSETINLDAIGFTVDIASATDAAFAIGHRGPWWQRMGERIGALWHSERIPAPVRFDNNALEEQIADVAAASDIARKDVRLSVTGTTVEVLTDTKPGKAIHKDAAFSGVRAALLALDGAPVIAPLQDDIPRATVDSATIAKTAALRAMARPVILVYEDLQFPISRERIGQWIQNTYDGDRLVIGWDTKAIGEYVTTVARQVAIASTPANITVEDGRVIKFIPPKRGRALEEGKTVAAIVAVLQDRTTKTPSDTIVLPMRTTNATIDLEGVSGITELIGKATTPFTGSPRNRISNIKNGVKFLSGSLIAPGAEFSTLATLGTIDNTTGYLPELVIKGDRTTPEFGGGLCQVSTTLFRAVMNAGLPVTQRRSHSFRISYYEKDGAGKYIGPGLDATIYDPEPDFRFRNDTASTVLIIGYVEGDKVTFELYGTKDGRTAQIIGPRVLSEVPAGDPIYTETDELAKGVTKQVETAHPGGSAIATYVISYPDGHKDVQEFKSWYRRWPARYLVGTKE